jgi:hypothetical protein
MQKHNFNFNLRVITFLFFSALCLFFVSCIPLQNSSYSGKWELSMTDGDCTGTQPITIDDEGSFGATIKDFAIVVTIKSTGKAIGTLSGKGRSGKLNGSFNQNTGSGTYTTTDQYTGGNNPSSGNWTATRK